MLVRRSAAQALALLTLTMPVFVSIAGLAIDGGVLLMSRRELQSVADGAARAGATRLDTVRLRASGGSDIHLDSSLAMDAARGYVRDAIAASTLAAQAPPDVQVDIGEQRVRVWVRANVKTAFLRIVHIDGMPVEANAYADVQFGIHDGGGG